jgi:hypothetical protein
LGHGGAGNLQIIPSNTKKYDALAGENVFDAEGVAVTAFRTKRTSVADDR